MEQHAAPFSASPRSPNAGVVFWTDIVVLVLGALLLWWRYGEGRGSRTATSG